MKVTHKTGVPNGYLVSDFIVEPLGQHEGNFEGIFLM